MCLFLFNILVHKGLADMLEHSHPVELTVLAAHGKNFIFTTRFTLYCVPLHADSIFKSKHNQKPLNMANHFLVPWNSHGFSFKKTVPLVSHMAIKNLQFPDFRASHRWQRCGTHNDPQSIIGSEARAEVRSINQSRKTHVIIILEINGIDVHFLD